MIRTVQIGTTLMQGEYKDQQSKPFMRGDELFATIFDGDRSYTGRLVPRIRHVSTMNMLNENSNSTKYRNHHDEIAAAVAEQEATNG